LIKFYCVGYQDNVDGKKGFFLFNLEQDILGHSRGSTVSERTLKRAGVTTTAIKKAIVEYLKSPVEG
jgi:hypothetical protein